MLRRSPLARIALAALVVAGCTTEAAPMMWPCPPLVFGAGSDAVSYGGLAGRSSAYVPGSCVEVHVGSQRVALTYVTLDRTFAVQWIAPGDLRGQAAVVVFEHLEDREGAQSFAIVLPNRAHAEIGYPPITAPVLADFESATFEGWLVPTPGADPLSNVLLVNWSTGALEVVSPSPDFAELFAATVPGRPGHLISPLSLHSDASGLSTSGYGGCWWPRGGGCRALCSDALIERGECDPVPCSGGRGCTILDVDERHSGTPPPALWQSIPVGRPPPPPEPPDSGPPPRSDGGVF